MTAPLTDWLRHPLASIVTGFILTGVLGTAITQHFLDQRAQEALQAQLALDRKKAVQQFSKLNEARKVRAEVLLQALRSSNDDALKTAKQEYEKAYVAWSVERQGMLLLFRDLLAPEDYQLVQARVQESLVEKIVKPIRRCLTASFGHRDDRAAAVRTLEDCRVDELIERSGTCGMALAAAVSDLAAAHSEWASAGQTAETRKRAQDSIHKHCP
ncbi:MAG: hypothetical protein AMJ63_13395 [Myxococcales bacterium SG8_38_1]|jgi:hypothetical protein|nr:MAG: hypothetical protein AMJ63_13395 [Myxococcales bacterium SG8_38_1]